MLARPVTVDKCLTTMHHTFMPWYTLGFLSLYQPYEILDNMEDACSTHVPHMLQCCA